jgi:hypothetical protein
MGDESCISPDGSYDVASEGGCGAISGSVDLAKLVTPSPDGGKMSGRAGC